VLFRSVHTTSCGGGSSSASTIPCQITYSCAPPTCVRFERPEGTFTGGTPTTVVTGIGSSSVFCFVPSANPDPTECGPVQTGVSPTYVGVNLNVPNPSGEGALTVSDGASLRTATLSY